MNWQMCTIIENYNPLKYKKMRVIYIILDKEINFITK